MSAVDISIQDTRIYFVCGDFLLRYDHNKRTVGWYRQRGTASSWPPRQSCLYSSWRRLLYQLWSSIARFKPDFALTLCPCGIAVPFADFDMLLTFKSSMIIMAWFLLISVVTVSADVGFFASVFSCWLWIWLYGLTSAERLPACAVLFWIYWQAGISSRLRNEFLDLREAYGKAVLWSRSYFAGSCGGAPLEVVKQYIQNQRGWWSFRFFKPLQIAPALCRWEYPLDVKMWNDIARGICVYHKRKTIYILLIFIKNSKNAKNRVCDR